MNALAAAAATLAAGVPLERVAEGLAAARPVAGRLRFLPGPSGACVIDDAYNANPASVMAALDVLAAQPGERWLALGDMGELGAAAAELHARIGRAARERGVVRLWAAGPLAGVAAEAFGDGAERFTDSAELAAALHERIHGDVVLLVKGSRAARMERVVEALCPAAGRGAH